MSNVESKLDMYLKKEVNENMIDYSNVVERLLDFIMRLNVNKLPPEQSAELNSILDSIVGKGEGDISYRISKSKLKMLTNKYKRTSTGKRLERKAAKAMEDM